MFVYVVMHREQFDGSNTELAKMCDGGSRSQAGIGAPQTLGHIGMLLCEAFDMQLVDNCFVPWRIWPAIAM